MPSPITGKAFYECPAIEVSDGMGGTQWQPLLASVVDAAGGVWMVSAQDSDTEPTTFLVVVNDRRSPSDPHIPQVHDDIAGSISKATYLGSGIDAARTSARSRVGSLMADRMLDQIIGGE